MDWGNIDQTLRTSLGLISHRGCDTKNEEFKVLANMMTDKEITGQEITEYFNGIHSTNCDQSIYLKESFLCLAAMHDRIDVFEHNQPLQQTPKIPRHDPLMVAVYKRNIPLIQLLIEAGYDPRNSKFLGMRFGGVGEDKSALDYVLFKDDVAVLRMFPTVSSSHISLKQIKTHHAHKCFLHILEKDRQNRRLDLDDVYETAACFDVTVLEEMKRIGYDDFKREYAQGGTMLHSAVREIFNNAQRSSQIEKLEYLISQEGVTAYRFDDNGKLPVDLIVGYLHCLDDCYEKSIDGEYLQRWKTCVNATGVLLSAMRKERADQELLMPRSSVSAMHHGFYFQICVRIMKGISGNQQILNFSLASCIQMLEMVLAAGVDLVNEEEEIVVTTSHMRFAAQACAVSPFKEGWDMIMMVGMSSQETLLACAEQIIKFNTLLLVYGMKPDGQLVTASVSSSGCWS